MNTLGYVARQFDVLAAPRAPPNTPTRDRHPALPRPPPPPAAPDAAPRSKAPLEAVIDQIFFIRVFLMVWDRLKAAWSSLVAWPSVLGLDPKGKRRAAPPDLVVDDAPSPAAALALTLARTLTPTRPTSLSISLLQTQSREPTVSVVQASPTPSSSSRAGTPGAPAKKTPFHRQKTLVLDLDETLIHSTSRPFPPQYNGSGLLSLVSFGSRNKGAGHMVEVVLGGRSTLYHVYKRPFVDFFLRTVSGWYTLVIFTASMQEYADPVIDWLDAGRGILEHRFFPGCAFSALILSCTQLPNGSYTKDLSVVEADLSRVCLVDNSPVSYSVNEANGIPIEGWTHDPSDEALLDLLPVLDSLRFTSDVRRVLGLRSAGVHFMTTSSALS
ncbi:NLI interacting factor-like phosphatase-domain-containing protein [Pholiota molesta]|nr:NLI interacting factor-like phosphatase-domain-containing protein [Pholiota molesta]